MSIYWKACPHFQLKSFPADWRERVGKAQTTYNQYDVWAVSSLMWQLSFFKAAQHKLWCQTYFKLRTEVGANVPLKQFQLPLTCRFSFFILACWIVFQLFIHVRLFCVYFCWTRTRNVELCSGSAAWSNCFMLAPFGCSQKTKIQVTHPNVQLMHLKKMMAESEVGWKKIKMPIKQTKCYEYDRFCTNLININGVV